tara:strand:+ start:2854 stop:3522 length:669 start_codon:yes stop_codon:yes gene_type:complete
MNSKEYSKLIKNFDSLNEENLIKLEKLTYNHPYCQNIYAHYLKSLKDQKKYNYDHVLKKTSIITIDRKQLYYWLNSDDLLLKKIKLSKLAKTSEIHNAETVIASSKEIKKSFIEWISLTNNNFIENKPSNLLKEKLEIIDKFIENKPRIPSISDTAIENEAIENLTFNKEEFMTETLAKIYIKQKKYDNALIAYKILSLNYPEKNSLFADQIKLIKKLKQNK